MDHVKGFQITVKCTRSASVSNNYIKCTRFSYLLELYRLSACGPTLEIFEQAQYGIVYCIPTWPIKKRFFDLGFRRIRYCIPNLPQGSFDFLHQQDEVESGLLKITYKISHILWRLFWTLKAMPQCDIFPYRPHSRLISSYCKTRA